MRNNKHKYRIWPFVVGVTVGLFFVLGVIEVIALLEERENAKFAFLGTADKWIALIGAILSYVGTCIIGIIAMWQNRNLSELNERLLSIEEKKVAPKLFCKANNVRNTEEGIRLFFQIEHRSGEEAYNLQITEVTMFQNEKVFTNVKVSPLNHDNDIVYVDGYLIYCIDCSDIVSEDSEIEMKFTLCYDDILGISHKVSQYVYWKKRSRNEYEDHNNVPQSRNDANERELAGIC